MLNGVLADQHALDEVFGRKGGEAGVEMTDAGQRDAFLGEQLEFFAQRGEARRRRRATLELDRVLAAMLGEKVRSGDAAARYEAQVDALVAGTTDPYRAARTLLFDS